jgi:CHAT domain-containing protein
MKLSRLLAILLLAALGTVLVSLQIHERREQSSLVPPRLIEPRLTGGFSYVPCERMNDSNRSVPRARCSALPGPVAPGHREPQRPLPSAKRSANRGQTAEELQIEGISQLLGLQEPTATERAIKILRDAVARTPGDARILNDLAAAYLLQAQENNDPAALLPALTTIEQAVSADGDLLEARFNRALILDYLFLREEAASAWRDYRKLDVHSGWADEAEKHLKILSESAESERWENRRSSLMTAIEQGDQATLRSIVGDYRQSAREYAEVEVLGAWAEAWQKRNDPEALRQLRIARAIGGALADLGGDRLVQDAVQGIDTALSEKEHRRLSVLASGCLAYREGFKLYKKYDTQRALIRLDEARSMLERGSNPLAWRAAFWHACGEYHLDRIAQSSGLFQDLWSRLEGSSYTALLGHIAWMQGLTGLVLGDSVKSVHYYSLAQSFFQKAGETENAISLNSLLAERLDKLGKNREGWERHYRSLRGAHDLRDPQLLYLVFTAATQSVLEHAGPVEALHFQDEVVRHVSGSNEVLQSEALSWRAVLHNLAHQHQRALEDLRQAREMNEKQASPEIAQSLDADLVMIQAEIALETDPARAAALLTTALESYESRGHRLLLLRAYRERARAYRRTGQMDLAEADLRSGLEAYESLGSGLEDEEIRLAFVERAAEIFDEMIAFQITERRRPDVAFAYADRSRTKVLPEAAVKAGVKSDELRVLLAREPQPLPLAEIRRSLSPASVLVQYSVLPDRLMTWVVRRNGFWSFEIPVSRGTLQKRIEQARDFTASEAAWKDSSASLYATLIRPWQALVRPEDLVIFVPDKDLNQVSFSCLWNPMAGRYLVEDHRITVAPSASIYSQPSKKENITFNEVRNGALVIGDPAFDRESFPELVQLPDALQEAKRIEDLYPGSILLTGPQADKRAFFRDFGKYPLVHFAVHAILNERNPLLSLLALAPGGTDSGALYAREIYSLDAKRTRLVVLAGCGTAGGYVPDNEGVTNLARSFLATGVPSVVASLWSIDDRASSEFLYTFHRKLLAGENAISALRAAQIAALREKPALRTPALWGAFQVFSVHQIS